MPEKQTSRSSQETAWRWWIPPLIAALTAFVIWLCMPKPAIPAIYDNAKPVADTSSSAPPGRALVANTMPGPADTTWPGAGGETAAASTAVAPNKTLVSLGDSITFGFNLPGASPNHPSPDAYPYLVGKHVHDRVINLGVPGYTSQDLLEALATPDYQKALRKADLVTVDIGSNDLLHTSYELLSSMQQTLPPKEDVLKDGRYRTALQDYSANLPKILDAIRTQTNAQIVLVNLYDPFPDGSSIHDIGEQLITAANAVILQVAAHSGTPVLDAYSVFNHQQMSLVRLSAIDIHPTIQGQQALAASLEDTLAHPEQSQPQYIGIAKQETAVRAMPLRGAHTLDWLEGYTGIPVTGTEGDWLQVRTPDGQTGYVEAKFVTVVVRPWNDVSFVDHSEHLPTGQMTDKTSGRTTDVFIWNGQVYAPVQYLATLANATMTVNSETQETDVETPAHSGLNQTGWLPSSNPSGRPQPGPDVNVKVASSRPFSFVQFSTVGMLISVDGEPVNLHAQAVVRHGQVEVPVEAFWQALGGQVKRDAAGLPMLSADGS